MLVFHLIPPIFDNEHVIISRQRKTEKQQPQRVTWVLDRAANPGLLHPHHLLSHDKYEAQAAIPR